MRPWVILLLLILIPAVIVLFLVVSAINQDAASLPPAKPATFHAESIFAPPPVIATTSSTTSTSTSTTTTTPRARTAPSKPAPTGAIADIIRAGFARFGPTVAGEAVRVSSCETGGTFNPRATNGSNTGLFQLNGQYHRARAARLGFTWAQMFEPAPNVAVAADLYGEQGWAPWACRWAA